MIDGECFVLNAQIVVYVCHTVRSDHRSDNFAGNCWSYPRWSFSLQGNVSNSIHWEKIHFIFIKCSSSFLVNKWVKLGHWLLKVMELCLTVNSCSCMMAEIDYVMSDFDDNLCVENLN